MIKAFCPICEKKLSGRTAADLPFLPFCSLRCKKIDLGRWLGEVYHLPAEDQDDPSEDETTEVP
jgi:endogenous inhibitor of DNA gyrase (YacG/DUF329 family)